ncbi:hypothetical protein FHW36_101981 [Chitinophaga polysaccharea]|uniref:Uncharacterized protein n=1 Tax=Chitinophaga polysaccharea TaxID=1293035 RepID=A0A561Q3X2_9BACT|nr:hypothetical protein FHW36_101981 [Chitinophaga polysaccharea]
MNGKELNAASKPLGMIEIKSCDINNLTLILRGVNGEQEDL